MKGRPGRGGAALVAALVVVLALAALLAGRSVAQLLQVEALAAETRALAAAAAADTALAWRLAEEAAAAGGPADAPLPTPLEGRSWRAVELRGVRIAVEAVMGGARARREALLAAPTPGPAPPPGTP